MIILAVFLSALCLATPAFAYIGPGVGLGAIGVLVAIVGGALLLLIGLLWYPLKRMLRGRREVRKADLNTQKK